MCFGACCFSVLMDALLDAAAHMMAHCGHVTAPTTVASPPALRLTRGSEQLPADATVELSCTACCPAQPANEQRQWRSAVRHPTFSALLRAEQAVSSPWR